MRLLGKQLLELKCGCGVVVLCPAESGVERCPGMIVGEHLCIVKSPNPHGVT